MAWIRMIDRKEAEGELATVYAAMANRPIPNVYRPPHGGAPGIHRTHSLDPKLLTVAFSFSGSLHAGEALTWSERELVAAAASRTNQCRY